MADPKRALEIIKQYYATVTPEKFLEDVRRAIPKEESPDDELFDKWVKHNVREQRGRHKTTVSYNTRNLHKQIKDKIFEQDHIDPTDQNTVDLAGHMRQKREQSRIINRSAKPECISSAYGGYNTEGLKFLTKETLDNLMEHSVRHIKQVIAELAPQQSV